MNKILLLTIISLFSFKTSALAEGVYTVIIQKQKEKESSRWSLADWFATQKKIALMDQWLALNSSSTWVEFIFDYAQGSLDETLDNNTVKVEEDILRFGASLYIKFLGFEYNSYDYSKLVKQKDYKINLLLLGSSVQSTHIRAFIGKRKYEYENYSTYDQSFYGASISLYLLSFLGGEYIYTKFNKTKSDNGVYQMYGERNEFGGFIELSFLRVYLNRFIERTIFTSTNRSKKDDEGIIFGAKIFL